MKLKSTPKPVRYRITSGELEHSSLGSLLQHFNYDELKKKWPSVIRWLERQGPVAEGIAKQLKENPNPTFEEAIIIFFKSDDLVELLKEWIDCGSNNLKFLRLEYFIDPDSIDFVYQHRNTLLPNVSMTQWREKAKNSSTKVSYKTRRDIEEQFKKEEKEETNNLVLKKIIEIAKKLGIRDGSVTDELIDEVNRCYGITLEGYHNDFIELANDAIGKLILRYFRKASVDKYAIKSALLNYEPNTKNYILQNIREHIRDDVPDLNTYKEIMSYCQIRPNK